MHNPHGGGNFYDLERALEEDLILTSVGWANSYYKYMKPGERYTDEWGVGWRVVPYLTRFGDGVYTEFDFHPLAEDGAIDIYIPPDPGSLGLYDEARRVIREYKNEYWIVGVI